MKGEENHVKSFCLAARKKTLYLTTGSIVGGVIWFAWMVIIPLAIVF